MTTEPGRPSPVARALGWLGRRLRPLFDPDHQQHAARLAKLASQIKALEGAVAQERGEVTQLNAVITELRREVRTDLLRAGDAATAGQIKVRDRLNRVYRSLRDQQVLGGRILNVSKHLGKLDASEGWVRRHLERVAKSDAPILVGPWTGEVGFELLYWVPFLRWAAAEYQIAPDRLIVMSRGGTAAWYGDLATRYVDVFDVIDTERFRARATEKLKQRLVSPFDRLLLGLARRQTGAGRVHVLHPSLMYQLFLPVWKGEATIERVFAFTRHARIVAAGSKPSHLPQSYVAVRFYFSSCFPDTPENRALITRTLTSLTRDHDVVSLDPGLRVDDHYDFADAAGSRFHSMGSSVTPAQNLALQTAVLAGSQGYVGTYGGYAYLAPMLGRDALAFYSVPNFFVHHLEVAQRAFGRERSGRLTTLDAATAALARSALA